VRADGTDSARGNAPSLLLVSWNLAGRVRALELQAQHLLALGADVLCLQELTPTTLPLWQRRLDEAGYAGIAHAPFDAGAGRARPLIVLSASREPLAATAIEGVPWPERALAARTPTGLEIVNVHSPISPKPGLAKVRTHLAVHAHLAREASHPRLLCGDLNTPRKEHADGRVWTFARDRYGRLREDRGEHWDRAELSLLCGLEPYGFSDAFRSLHGYGAKEISWGWPRWPGGYRLDHLLCARAHVTSCRYEHGWREEGLSDHAALVAELHPLEPGPEAELHPLEPGPEA
jgi:exonuclease III